MSAHKEIAAMCLYCCYIIYKDTDKAETLERLKADIKNDEHAERIAKKFENKLMNLLAKETKIRGRKNMAITVLSILDPKTDESILRLWE